MEQFIHTIAYVIKGQFFCSVKVEIFGTYFGTGQIYHRE